MEAEKSGQQSNEQTNTVSSDQGAGSMKDLPTTRYLLPGIKEIQPDDKSKLMALHDDDIAAEDVLGKDFDNEIRASRQMFGDAL